MIGKMEKFQIYQADSTFEAFLLLYKNIQSVNITMLTRSLLKARPNVARNLPAGSVSVFVTSRFATSPIQTRGFKKITVTNPFGIKLLRSSRYLGKSLLIAYAIASSAFLFFYFRDSQKAGKEQSIPSEWSFRVKSLVQQAVNFELDNNLDVALVEYKLAIDVLTKDEKTGEFLDLRNKSPEWFKGYSDLLVRAGRLMELLENRQEAREALEASHSIPWGNKDLKSEASVQLAKYQLEDKNIEAAETLFIEAVQIANDPETKLKPLTGTSYNVIIPNKAKLVTFQLYLASIELGRFYAVTGQYSKALEVFLSTLRSVKFKRQPDSEREHSKIPDNQCVEARLMEYIAEVMWATGKKTDAVTWVESSYYESYPLSSSTVECGLCATLAMENAAKMYKNLGLVEDAEKALERKASLNPPLTNVRPEWNVLDLFRTNTRR